MEPPPQPTPSLQLTLSTLSPILCRSRSRATATPIPITKVKILLLYTACKCYSSIAIRVRGVATSWEVVTWTHMRELQIETEYVTGARSYTLKRSQEPHFNYCIRYSLQIWRAYRYGEASYSKVVRFTEHPLKLHIQIPFQSEASILHTSVQPVEPQTRVKSGRNAFFLPDFQFIFNLTGLPPNIPLANKEWGDILCKAIQ